MKHFLRGSTPIGTAYYLGPKGTRPVSEIAEEAEKNWENE